MSWRFPCPVRSDYDTDEEYFKDLDYYYQAADQYADEYLERRRG